MENARYETLIKTAKIAVLIAAASALQCLEAPITAAFPWVKVGLANILTLYAVIRLSASEAILIAAGRTFLSALILGSLFTPFHFMSFSGAVSSAVLMAFLHKAAPKISLSLKSIFGAVASNSAQLLAISFLFKAKINLYWYFGAAILFSVPAGLLNAKITEKLLQADG